MNKLCFILVFCIIIMSSLVSCQNSNSDIAKNSNTTVVSDESQLTEELPEKFKGYKVLKTFTQNDYAIMPTMDNIIAYSKYSVVGTVNDIDYVSLGTNAWTIINVSVEETLSGNVPENSVIKVYTYGGYIPLRTKLGDSIDKHGINMTDEEIDNTVIYEYADETETPEIGKKYVFYLVDGNSAMENGSYEGFFGKYGRLEITGTAEFTRKNSSGQLEKYNKSDLIK